MAMQRLSIAAATSSILLVVQTFTILSEDVHQKCYELELENCFREAFLSAIHPPLFQKRHIEPPPSSDNSTVERKTEKKYARQIQVCHDVRKFSSCFIHPGCTDYQAANIASVQYHMVFGRKLPMNVFLAYRGYGRELCDQQCSKESLQVCKRSMKQDEQQEEQGLSLELSSINGHIMPNKDITVACSRFTKVLMKLIRLRKRHCGEIAQCTCSEQIVQQGVDGCNTGCNHLLYLNLDEVSACSHHFSLQVSIVLVILVSSLFNYL